MWMAFTVAMRVALAADPAHDDADLDGWCPSGVDLDGDRRCDAAVEAVPLGDCDDTPVTGASMHPGAAESCAGPDMNCDGQVGLTDHDGDGFNACDDCDDNWIATHPTATEVCGDQRDNDCDGVMFSLTHADALTVYTDADHDGWGDSSTARIVQLCELLPGESFKGLDCNDADATAWPGARTGGDNCDGFDGTVDHDGDGVDADIDCNDGNPAVRPGIPELCFDLTDNNCDGATDEVGGVGAAERFPDRDRDGQGDPATPTSVCAYVIAGVSYVTDNTDCDDGEWTLSGSDRDRDGLSGCDGDCDDEDPDVNPSTVEIPGNGKDDDCVDGDAAVVVADTDVPTDTALTAETDAVEDTDATADSDDIIDTGSIPFKPPGCGCETSGERVPVAALLLLAAFARRRRAFSA